MGLSARIFGIFAAILLLFSVTKTTFAQNQNLTPNTNPGISNNLHNYTQSAILEVMSAMICQLAGIDFVNPNQPCLGIDRQSGKIGFVQNGGGAIGMAGTLIAGTYIIPVHFSDFIASEINSFGVAKKSYAQGIGFIGLQPVLGLFTTFRNISYLLFVVIFVLVGVAIMLRLRIDPRTVMTIQNQIPKLIIGLVMITFSYAIAGFLIDTMWVGTYFVVRTLAPQAVAQDVEGNLTQPAPTFVDTLFGGTQGGMVGLSFTAAGSVNDLILNTFGPKSQQAKNIPTNDGDCGINPACLLGNIASNTIGAFLSAVIAWFIAWIAGIIAFFIFAIAILVQLFKLWFALLKSFITVLLDVILAPFWILAGLLPGAGQGVGIGAWLRDLAANLAVFPAVVFLFLIARTIMDTLSASTTNATDFSPPLLGNVNGGGANGNIYAALIAVGFILSAPNIVEQVKKALKAGGIGGGIGGLGTGQALILGGLAGAYSRSFRYHSGINPKTGEYERFAVGAGARTFDSKIRGPIMRRIFGRKEWVAPHEKVREAGTPQTITPEQTSRAQREQADRE